MVRSYYPIVAVLLLEGIGITDCFRLPRDFRETFGKLQTSRGRDELSLHLGKLIPEIPWKAFDEQLEVMDRCGVGVVTFLDPGFPRYLRDIPKSPPILFFKGDLAALERRGVAIVGSRRPSARGTAFTRRLAGDLAERGILVTSGAARGIDSAAHKGALDRDGVTAAVVGTGLDVTYPEENAGLLEAIARDGCVLTEQLMGTMPQRFVFPLRNRLISGISQVVVVVEAGERSGALITAQWALEQGRDVGAVPGFPGDARTRGTNALLKMGAFPVEGVDDILEAVPKLATSHRSGETPGVGGTGPGRSAQERPDTLTEHARAVLDALSSCPTDPDTVAAHAGLPAAAVQRSLLELELRGFVERDGSGLYYKI